MNISKSMAKGERSMAKGERSMAKRKQSKSSRDRTSPRKVTSKVRKPASKREPFANVDKLTSHILFLFVGTQSPTLITLHTKLLPATTKAFLDSTAMTVGFYLLDDDLAVAQIWRHFLYFGVICTKQDNPDEEWEWLADAYLLGAYLKDEKFCNAVIDAVIDKQIETGDYPTTLAAAVYARTTRGDCLRELVTDMHVWAGQGAGLTDTEDADEAPQEFRRAVRARLRKLGGQINDPKVKYPWEIACAYHKHTTTEKCFE